MRAACLAQSASRRRHVTSAWPHVACVTNADASNARDAIVVAVSKTRLELRVVLWSSSITASAVWKSGARVRSNSVTSHTLKHVSHGSALAKSAMNHDDATACKGHPFSSSALTNAGVFASANSRNTSWSTKCAFIAPSMAKYSGKMSSNTWLNDQNAASSSMSKRNTPAMKFMPWQYPTLGFATANARNTRSNALRIGRLSSCACPGNVRGTSLAICSRVCLVRGVLCADDTNVRASSSEDEAPTSSVASFASSRFASSSFTSSLTRAASDGYAPGTRTSSTRRQSCQSSPRSAMGTPPRTSDSSSRSRRGASAEHAPRSRFRRISSTASSPVPLEERTAGAPNL